MPMQNWKGKEVAVIGAGGKTGTALVKYLCASGALVTAYDEKPESELQLGALKNYRFTLDIGKTPKHLDRAKLVLVTPGISADVPYLAEARKRGTPVWGEVEFASHYISTPILAVTGTNGKSTTTSLLGHILSTWGKTVFTGGNLGDPLIHAVDRKFDFIVAEVSSFQLETVETFHPRVGVLLNLSPNHLDRHGTMENYAAMKTRLFSQMKKGDRAILSAEDDWCRAIAKKLQSDVWLFSISEKIHADIEVRNGSVHFPDGESISLSGWKLPGRHNIENAVAAIAAARAVHCSVEKIESALATFHGLPHRLEELGEIRGVRFINDSKSTTPGAAIRALESFDSPIIWMAGGRSKGTSYDPISVLAKKKAKAIILFGEAGPTMKASFGDHPVRLVKTMREAFQTALSLAKSGDVVLFSPANASFDEFKDFEERGETFRRWVESGNQER